MELAGITNNSPTNKTKFFAYRKIEIKNTVSAKLAHSNIVYEAKKSDGGKIINSVDGLITTAEKLFLTITVADCFPVYFYSPNSKTIGLAHVGWKGAISSLVSEMIRKADPNPQNVFVAIGPGIGVCHFEIKSDILPNFQKYPNAIFKKQGKIFVDLNLIINQTLLESGVNKTRIENLGQCTYCNPEKYFSFRRDKPEKVQAMTAFIGLI